MDQLDGIRSRRVLAVLLAAIMVCLPGTAQARTGTTAHQPYAQLTSVGCTSARDCVAVGFHTIGTGSALYPLAEAWNGHRWRLLATPVIPGVLLGVACPRRADCVAVGSHDASQGGATAPLAATWNGRTWRLRATAPAGIRAGAVDLAAISCTGPRHCVAASGYGDAEPTLTAAAERWNGRTWRLRAVFGQSSLNGMACKTRAACLAVGSTSPASDSWVPFAVARGTSGWAPVATPPGDGGNLDTSMSGVSCAAIAWCMAVGEGMLTDEWTGSAWTQLTTPGLGRLDGVSCRSRAACVAVGQDGQQQAAAQAWDGANWRALAPVLPSGSSDLAHVFCSTALACLAVGYYGTTIVRHTLAEQWDGTSWHQLTMPPA